jgi:hypothetical protein
MADVETYFAMENPPGPLFILTSGDHLNDENATYKIEKKAFKELKKTIKGIGKSVRVSGRK